MQVRFDHSPAHIFDRSFSATDGAPPCLFERPTAVIQADHPSEVPAALAALDRLRAGGAWIAGYASYELGYALEPKLAARMPADRRLPLLRFGAYGAPKLAAPLEAKGAAGFEDITPLWDEPTYRRAFDTVHAAIGAGDIYQANLTFALRARAVGSSEALYAGLMARQAVGHGALVIQDGLPDLLSRSPELFFATDAEGRIETRPMKGTQPRSQDPQEDARRKAFLRTDEKNNAENLMIVDLLRNDLSRVAKAGSVRVPELFHVESYATVHQMVSTVTAQLREGVSLSDILRALYPCGSITGAPKIRAMEILAGLEPEARDIYCGTIGWMAPDGASRFNVAIRTVMVEDGEARLNVGGGVVWDSTAASEYEEALWKARFANLFQMEPC